MAKKKLKTREENAFPWIKIPLSEREKKSRPKPYNSSEYEFVRKGHYLVKVKKQPKK